MLKPIDYFKQTFKFVFLFFIVYKAVELAMNKFEGFDLRYVLKNLLAAIVVSLILATINYFAKVDFFNKKGDRKPKDN